MRPEEVVTCLEVLRHDLGVGEHRHEIRISIPTWHDMPVQMVCNSGPGGLPQVQPNIEPVGGKNLSYDLHRPAKLLHHFAIRTWIDLFEIRRMHSRGDHQMTIAIGKTVHQNDEGVLGREHERLSQIIPPGEIAEDTLRVGLVARDVLHAPGRPERILGHDQP